MIGDDNSLGKFYFDGIPPAERGVPQEIDSLFDDIDFSCCRKHTLRS